MLSKALELTLNTAFKAARKQRHEFITVEHLLFALLDNPDVIPVLMACNADVNTLRGQLARFIDETASFLPESTTRDTQPTLGFQRVLQRAVRCASCTAEQRGERRECGFSWQRRGLECREQNTRHACAATEPWGTCVASLPYPWVPLHRQSMRVRTHGRVRACGAVASTHW